MISVLENLIAFFSIPIGYLVDDLILIFKFPTGLLVVSYVIFVEVDIAKKFIKDKMNMHRKIN